MERYLNKIENHPIKKYLNKLENYPIGICGTVLGFITVSNAWAINKVNFLKPIAISLAIIVISLMILRLALFPKKIGAELKNPVAGSFYPTIDMSLFLIAAFLQKSSPKFASALWLFAAILHFSLILSYTFFRIKNRNFSEVIPSWFVVYVGLITGSLASKGMGYDKLAKFMVLFGTTAFLVLWPVMLYKIFTNKVDKDKIATCAIIAAPGSLALAGVISMFKTVNLYFVIFLGFASIFNVLIVYYFAFKLSIYKFKPNFATFTFPLAISVLAIYKFSEFLAGRNLYTASTIVKFVGHFEIVVATTIILFILLNFIKMFITALKDA